jgi:acetyl-CoA C-acetyltransferase
VKQPVYIVLGKRTPIGAYLGTLSSLPAAQLGARAIQAVVTETGLSPEAVDEVLMGCVLSAGQGQAPARQAMRAASLPDTVGATTINKVCGSGMKALMLGASSILLEDANVVVAGGMESMSQVPFYLKDYRQGVKMGHQSLLDGMIYDGLWDPYHDIHMGQAAEQCAEKYGFTRQAQDDYAAQSYHRALAAIAQGAFAKEITPVDVVTRRGQPPTVVDKDEQPFKGDVGKLAGLKPAFQRDGGTVTAGNASSLNDGAAVCMLASQWAVDTYHLSPVARIVAWSTHSQAPVWFTTAPVGAVQKLLVKTGLTVSDIDLFEINEAFALVAMAAIQDLQLDPAKVNIRGGAVSLGHPIGASGARLVVTLLSALADEGLKRGVATLCIGGGEATALLVERL